MDAGLEKVVAAETILSDVQGAEGRLIIRGLEVEDLARNFDFEGAASHLWTGFFDSDLSSLKTQLGATRVIAFERLKPDFSRPINCGASKHSWRGEAAVCW